MAVRVLVVDDSAFFRRRLVQMLEADARLVVVGTAADGSEALAKARDLDPDILVMDIEMPVMDGISAVRELMRVNPKPVLMFSSLTRDGAKATFEALAAGAMDFLPKSFESVSRNLEDVARELRARIWSLAARRLPGSGRCAAPQPVRIPRRPPAGIDVLAIGASTGGPVALPEILSHLGAGYRIPILLIQHMPPIFTSAFAQRMDQMLPLRVREAREGDLLEPGLALLAPGGRQLLVERFSGKLRVALRDGRDGEHYRPSLDICFASLAESCPGRTLAVVLTGMGSDGREGARMLKRTGALVWAQDEASSVVYGMPMAVAQAGLADEIHGLRHMGPALREIG